MSLNLARVCLSSSGSLWRLLPSSVSVTMSKRTLISKSEMRMDAFLRQRTAFNDRLSAASSNREKYVAKLGEQLTNEKNTIFSEDLNTLMTVAETKEDAVLAMNMLKRLQAQIKAGVALQDYQFGPVVMRMFNYLRLPDEAYACYRDPQFKDLFANMSSGLVLLDTLYEGGKYQEVLEAYELLKNKFPDWYYPRAPTFAYVAACYKIGTPEAFEKVRKVFGEVNRLKSSTSVRTAATAGLLALKLKDYNFVVECERTLTLPERSAMMLCVRVLNALEQNNYEQVISLLDFMRRQFAVRRLPIVTSDVIKRVEALIAKFKEETSDTAKSLANRLETVQKELTADQLVDTKTLEEHIFNPPQLPPRRNNRPDASRRFGRSPAPFRRDGQPAPRRFGSPGQFNAPNNRPQRNEGFGQQRQFGGPRQFPQRQFDPQGDYGEFAPRGQFRANQQGGSFGRPQPGQQRNFNQAPQQGNKPSQRRRQIEEDEDD